MIRYDQAQNKPQNRASVQIWTDFEICKSEGAMKYDLTKPLTRGAKRTLDAFRREMFSRLSEKPFEEITVGELCENAQYPRATFYNYFDDKYDLLNYCWLSLAEEIGLSEYHYAPESQMLFLYFDRIYSFTKEHIELISKMLLHNSEVGYMFSSLRSFMNRQMRAIFKDCPDALEKKMPTELLADHYSNTLFLVWQWATMKDRDCGARQAQNYLRKLLFL